MEYFIVRNFTIQFCAKFLKPSPAAMRNRLLSTFSNFHCLLFNCLCQALLSICLWDMVDGIWSNSVDTKPLAVDHPLVAQLFSFLDKLRSWLPAMPWFLGTEAQTDD